MHIASRVLAHLYWSESAEEIRVLTSIAGPECFVESLHRCFVARLSQLAQSGGLTTPWDVAQDVFDPAHNDLRDRWVLPADVAGFLEKRDDLISAFMDADLLKYGPTKSAEQVMELAYRLRELTAQGKLVRASIEQVERAKKALSAGYCIDPADLAAVQKELTDATERAAERTAGKRRKRWTDTIAAALDPATLSRISIPTGFTLLDRGGSPFAVGEFTVLGMGTGLGKSLIAGTFLRCLAFPDSAKPLPSEPDTRALRERLRHGSHNVRALLIGTESNARDYVHRLQQDLMGCEAEDLSDPERRAKLLRERAKLAAEFGWLASEDSPVQVADRSAIAAEYGGTGREIESIIKFVRLWATEQRREAKARGEEAPRLLALLDYLQIVETPEEIAKKSRIAELKYASQLLCDLAEQDQIAVVVTAQLNGRIGFQTPETATVREAGDIEHFAHVLLYGDAVGHKNAKILRANAGLHAPCVELCASTLKLMRVKGRNTGCPDDVYLHVDYKHQRISEYSVEQHALMTEQMFGDPIAWAREHLPKPGGRRRKPEAEMTPFDTVDEAA